MPHLIIQTNLKVSADEQETLLTEASHLTSESLGKPESYVMVTLTDQKPMAFAGTTEPSAYLELKSIGLSGAQTKALSSKLCHFMETKLNVPAGRVYIEFADAARDMWGWNNQTFA
ncbi:MAG: phenylpyruvate tautomerase MIF-related protein [Verrucomicrobiota bacterium]